MSLKAFLVFLCSAILFPILNTELYDQISAFSGYLLQYKSIENNDLSALTLRDSRASRSSKRHHVQIGLPRLRTHGIGDDYYVRRVQGHIVSDELESAYLRRVHCVFCTKGQ